MWSPTSASNFVVTRHGQNKVSNLLHTKCHHREQSGTLFLLKNKHRFQVFGFCVLRKRSPIGNLLSSTLLFANDANRNSRNHFTTTCGNLLVTPFSRNLLNEPCGPRFTLKSHCPSRTLAGFSATIRSVWRKSYRLNSHSRCRCCCDGSTSEVNCVPLHQPCLDQEIVNISSGTDLKRS